MTPPDSGKAPSRIGQALRRTFSSLRTRNFRLFFFGQTISNTGNWLTRVALTLLVLDLSTKGVAVGLLAACEFGPIILLSAWAGAIADRYDKRHLLLLTQSLEMAQSIALAILAFTPNPPLIWIYIISIGGGILLAFDNPLRRSFVTEMVPREDIPNAVVLYSTIVNISRIFGPALAGLLVVTVGYGWCFTIDAASYIAVLYGLLAMRTEELYRKPGKPGEGGSVREGLIYVRSMPALWISLSMFAAIGTLAYNFSVSLPLFVTYALHQKGTVFTILYSIYACGAVLCALVVANRNFVKMKHIIYGALFLGLTLLLLAIAPSVAISVPIVFLAGAASIIYMTATTAIIQIEGRPDMHGRVLALQTVLLGGSLAIGGPLLGWLSDMTGARSIMVIGGLTCLIASAFGYLSDRRHAAEEAQQPEC